MTNDCIYYSKDSDKELNPKDSFGIHTHISNAILTIIQNCNIESSSFTLGLFGSYGSGKSYIIKDLRKKLKSDNNNIFVTIDIWKYEEETLLKSILFEIDYQIKQDSTYRKYFPNGYEKNGMGMADILYSSQTSQVTLSGKQNGFKKSFINFWKTYKVWLMIILVLFLISPSILLLFPVLWQYVKDNSALSAVYITFVLYCLKPVLTFFSTLLYGIPVNKTIQPSVSPEQFESIFKDIVENIHKKGKKLIIVFDNIDRCCTEKQKILSTIQTYMDLQNCFYIVACDEVKANISTDTIEKIFDTYYRIPILKEYDCRKYIDEIMEYLWISKQIPKEKTESVKRILFYAYRGLTPREIKRFINDLTSYYILAKEVEKDQNINLLSNLELFIIMMVIKQKWPELEELIKETPVLLQEYYKNIISYSQFIEEKLSQKLRKDVCNFLNNVSEYISDEKDYLKYVYFKDVAYNKEIQEMLLSGNSLTIQSEEESIIINKTAKSILQNNNMLQATPLANIKVLRSLVNTIETNINYSNIFNKTITDYVSAQLNNDGYPMFYLLIDNIPDNIKTLYKILSSHSELLATNVRHGVKLYFTDTSRDKELHSHKYIFSQILDISDFKIDIDNIYLGLLDNVNSRLPQILEYVIQQDKTESITESIIIKILNTTIGESDYYKYIRVISMLYEKRPVTKAITDCAYRIFGDDYEPPSSNDIHKYFKLIKAEYLENEQCSIIKQYLYNQIIKGGPVKKKLDYLIVKIVLFNTCENNDINLIAGYTTIFINCIPDTYYLKKLLSIKEVFSILDNSPQGFKLLLEKFSNDIEEFVDLFLHSSETPSKHKQDLMIYVKKRNINLSSYLIEELSR
ncbi:MAG: P-loop NTPase fold protein [Candidatus Gastranaerophilaceae bacterium]